jgi:heterodisulfide reductase subunit B
MKQEFDMKLSLDVLKKMVRAVVTTKPDEIGCDECFAQVDEFVELKLQGKNAAEAMPLVQDHLTRCNGCREEFEALLDCIRATTE